MKIKTIKVSNFKGIDNLEISFDGKSTIIFGINGAGKSTILRAIDLIYANVISKLLSSKKKLAQLEYDDISYGKSRAKIHIVLNFQTETKKNIPVLFPEPKADSICSVS